MQKNSLKVSPILIIMVPSMIAATLYCYYMAVKYDNFEPFPHATVTKTARLYPQNIVFRFVMLIFSSTLCLSYFILFRWINSQAKRTEFEQLPNYLFNLGIFSIFCYAVTIGTIDQNGTGKWHGPCAVTFFIIWMISIINITVYLTKLRNWDTTTISYKSLLCKQLLAIYIACIWIYCCLNLIFNPDN